MNQESRNAGTELQVHVCRPGLIMEETGIQQQADGTWRATQEIGAIFGAEVEGQLEGVGSTKDEALTALANARLIFRAVRVPQRIRHGRGDNLYESLWV